MWTLLPVEPASIKMPKVVASSRSTTSYFVLAAAWATSQSRRRRIARAARGCRQGLLPQLALAQSCAIPQQKQAFSSDCCASSASLRCLWGLYKANKYKFGFSLVSYVPLAQKICRE